MDGGKDPGKQRSLQSTAVLRRALTAVKLFNRVALNAAFDGVIAF